MEKSTINSDMVTFNSTKIEISEITIEENNEIISMLQGISEITFTKKQIKALKLILQIEE